MDTPAFQIVEYTPEHAAALACMWNRSGDSWGGSAVVHTRETVLAAHAASINLSEYLAVTADGEVIGFCSFSRYAQDTGALYIPLLNVRPDWHGRKVGKALVLACVRRTVEMGWPRLDLYTWAGNTKAVPTYKKCGFFWERRDDTTHLMNFIPTVLSTRLLAPFFETADWYADAVREIRVEPDGEERNGFHFYEYAWRHGDARARAGFERTGRGLRLVETDDFRIVMDMDAHEVVSGRAVPVRFHFRNKSGIPMHVTVTGVGSGYAPLDAALTARVADDTVLETACIPRPLPEPQNPMRTHPCVTAEITVNGVPAVFRMGVKIQPPARFMVVGPQSPALEGEMRTGWINVENCLDEPASFELALPATEVLVPTESFLAVSLAAKARCSLPFPHTIGKNGYWNVSAPATARLASGGEIAFHAPLRLLAKGWRGRYAGEDDGSWFIVNGPYAWHLSRHNGDGSLYGMDRHGTGTWFQCPSLGKPFSNEFRTVRPERVVTELVEDCILQHADFVSGDFPGVTVRTTVRLWAHGELHRSLAVINTSGQDLARPIHLADSIHHDLKRAVMPYDGAYVGLTDDTEENGEFYDLGHLTENWIFRRGEDGTRGLCWDPALKPASGGLTFEHEPGCLPAGGIWTSPAVILAVGMYEKWQDFRAFALRRHPAEPLHAEPVLKLAVNGGNPFPTHTGGGIPVSLTERRHADLNGSLRAAWVASPKTADGADSVTASDGADATAVWEGQAARRADLTIPLPRTDGGATLACTLATPDMHVSMSRRLFPVSTRPVAKHETFCDGRRLLTADNGCLSISVSDDFSHALHSLKVDGHEWLETSFPTPVPHAWWGSWPGGIATKPIGLRNETAHSVARTASAATFTDQFGNRWEGLSTTFTVDKHPRFKGLTLTNCWLMLPGVPVLVHLAEIVNRTGAVLQHEPLECECFLRPVRDLDACWFLARDRAGNDRILRAGGAQQSVEAHDRAVFGADGHTGILQAMADTHQGPLQPDAGHAYLGLWKTFFVSAPDGETTLTDPLFLLSDRQAVPASELEDLLRLRFTRQC